MTWYMQSAEARDTHWGTLKTGRVTAECEIVFWPLAVAFGGRDRPEPPESDLVCSVCRRAQDAR